MGGEWIRLSRKEAPVGTMQDLEQGNLAAGWESWRCAAGSCPEGRFHAMRRSPGLDLWLVHERPGWLMAATQPVCPGCGMPLRRAA